MKVPALEESDFSDQRPERLIARGPDSNQLIIFTTDTDSTNGKYIRPRLLIECYSRVNIDKSNRLTQNDRVLTRLTRIDLGSLQANKTGSECVPPCNT